MYYLLKMGIFHCYVSLPEGTGYMVFYWVFLTFISHPIFLVKFLSNVPVFLGVSVCWAPRRDEQMEKNRASRHWVGKVVATIFGWG